MVKSTIRVSKKRILRVKEAIAEQSSLQISRHEWVLLSL